MASLTIPPISFGRDNSPAKVIDIGEGVADSEAQQGELLLEVESDRDTLYPGEQVVVTLKLLRTINISNGTLTRPEFAQGEAEVVPLGEDRRYEVRRGEQRYAVIEQRYALFPKQEGVLELKPFRFEGMVAAGSRLGLQLFNQKMQVRRILSEPLRLEVKAQPELSSTSVWLPARRLSFSDNWGEVPRTLRVGEPLTRTVVLEAEGVTLNQLPDITLSHPEQVKVYPDRPEFEQQIGDEGVISRRIGRIAYIPLQAGELIFPAQVIHWWNSQSGQLEQATMPSRRLQVLPALASQSLTQAANDSAGIEGGGGGESAAAMGTGGAVPSSLWAELLSHGGVLWLALWLVTLLLWLLHYRYYRHAPRTRWLEGIALRRQIRRRLVSGDPAQAERGLLLWGRLCSPDRPPRSLGEMALRASDSVAEEIVRLTALRYYQRGEAWSAKRGELLWRQLQQRPQLAPSPVSPQLPLLPPLPSAVTRD